MRILILSFILILSSFAETDYRLPVGEKDRCYLDEIVLTDIGAFGLLRKARPKVRAHFHTGIDIKRPSNNYVSEPIYPIFDGIVISKRTDGPYAQLIIEHEAERKFWTVYEHIAGIEVDLYDNVNTNEAIARFMNKNELNKYGWQFDHLHFEVLKEEPIRLKPDPSKPERRFASYSLVCYTPEDLNKYFYDPLGFLEKHLP